MLGALDADCRSHLATYLRPAFWGRGEYLFKALEVAMEMYFVTSGDHSVTYPLHMITCVEMYFVTSGKLKEPCCAA